MSDPSGTNPAYAFVHRNDDAPTPREGHGHAVTRTGQKVLAIYGERLRDDVLAIEAEAALTPSEPLDVERLTEALVIVSVTRWVGGRDIA